MQFPAHLPDVLTKNFLVDCTITIVIRWRNTDSKQNAMSSSSKGRISIMIQTDSNLCFYVKMTWNILISWLQSFSMGAGLIIGAVNNGFNTTPDHNTSSRWIRGSVNTGRGILLHSTLRWIENNCYGWIQNYTYIYSITGRKRKEIRKKVFTFLCCREGVFSCEGI